MIGSYGYAAPRTRATLLRASALIDNSTEQPQKFAILYGIWASHYVAGEVAKQRSAAAKFLSEAKRTGDTGARCIAHRIVGTAHIVKGGICCGISKHRSCTNRKSIPSIDISMVRTSEPPYFAISVGPFGTLGMLIRRPRLPLREYAWPKS